jgi:Na+/melibiose symporter-like transporter
MRSLTATEKWSYAIGNMPYAVKDAAFINFVVFYYTQVHGLSGALAGLAAFIALSWDAVTDPVVGSWSDRFRSRWGRRHPLILVGGLGTAFMFLALFAPPSGLSETGVFAWLTITAMLLRTFLTINFIPFQAMGAELSQDYDERTTIAKARVAMGWLAGILLPAVALAILFQPGADGDGRLVAANYHTYGVFSTVIAAVTTLFCVWGTRSLIARLPVADGDHTGIGLARTISDFRVALANRNFRVSIGSNLAFGMAAGVYSTLALYMGTYYWEFSSNQLAGLVVPMALATVLAFSVLGRIGRRYDKPTLLCFCCLGIAVNTLWFVGGRQLGLWPENGHTLVYALQLLNTAIGVFTIVSLHTVSASLLADILDENEVATGRRQEGVFFAAGAFVQKATSGFGTLAAGIVIDIAAIQPGTQPGEVSAQSLDLLGLFMLGIITALGLIAFIFARKIRLSREDHQRLQASLAARAM